MASRSALWVLGVARFTSSASTQVETDGPLAELEGVPAALRFVDHGGADDVPRASIRRELDARKVQIHVPRPACDQHGLSQPGTPSRSACETGEHAREDATTTSRLPTMTRPISSRSVPIFF